MSVQATKREDAECVHDSNSLTENLLVHDIFESGDFGVWQEESATELFEDEVLPYSFRNEISYFFRKGIPLGLSSFLKWGAPPWFAMVMAGQTEQSESLQSDLGYGRVFYNCTLLMLLVGACNYFNTVIPGCIGAGRRERIPCYLKRSLLMVLMLMIPFFILQFFARPIMLQFGVPHDIASDIGVYCRLMIITALFLILDIHLETIFINLGYVRCATFNSLITGIGVDVTCTYIFIYKLNWGMFGAGVAQIIVKTCRNLVWIILICYYDLFSTICTSTNNEVVISAKEVSVFLKLAVPFILKNLAGWFIFELQIMAIANINGITAPALAAGAIWIQSETILASIQQGWIQITMMRTLKLLGMQDPGAAKSYTILCVLSSLVVVIFNIPLILWGKKLATVVSNDPDVQEWFGRIVWVLAAHSQSRIGGTNGSVLFIPMGKGLLGVAVKFFCFYFIATPFGVVMALTDLVTRSVIVKLTCCLGTVAIAQIFVAAFDFIYLFLMDWDRVAKVINDRANTDK